MAFGLKLLVFWLCIIAIIFCVSRYPRSLPAKILLSWQGPKPIVSESKSYFLLRYGLWAFGWFVQLVAVNVAGVYVLDIHVMTQHPTGIVIFAFVLPILAAMALLGSVLLFINSFLSRVFKKKMVFTTPPGDFVAIVEEKEHAAT